MPPAPRVRAFAGGVFVLVVVVGSPLAVLDHELLTFHMLQHLLLMTVAAPLLLMGIPARMLKDRVPPVFCWLASTAVIIGWHVPALFALGMHSGAWHEIEQASFLGAGILFWLPVARSETVEPGAGSWFVPLYLFLATIPCDALSAFLAFCNRVVYRHYSSAPWHGIAPLRDQEFAGALMWVWVTFAYLAPAVVAVMRLLTPQVDKRARGI